MRLLILCITFCSLQLWLATDAHGQLFKFLKKKDKQQAVGFVLEEGMTPEEREKAIKRQLVNPVREMLNRFNLQVEKSFGFFNYQNTLEGVTVVRSSNLENLYAVPLGNESLTLPEPQGIDNWTTDLNATTFPRIDDDSHLVGTDTAALIYRNPGSINPLTLRLSFSLKKLDKEHFKTTGDKRYLDEDLLRIGGGISFGKIKFRNEAATQDVLPILGNYEMPATELSTTQLFGSLTYNFYSLGDFSMLADVKGGVWKIKTSQVNNELITYDPFVNVGVMFQTTFSKYFKGYIRPSVELRSYTLANDVVTSSHQFTLFSVDFGLLLKYPTYPRNPYPAHQVQMEHVFNGKMYRGRPFYQKQNPRYGQNRVRRKPVGFSFKRAKDKNEKKKGGDGN